MTFSHRSLLQFVAAFAVVSVVSACGGGDGPSGPNATPTTISVESGNGQTGAAGATLPSPLVVKVTDKSGNPVSGATINWDVSTGSGSTNTTANTSDGNGRAQVTWTLGSNAGTGKVTAQVGGITPATFSATIQAGAPSLVVAFPDAATLPVGDTITVHASVRDQFGNDVGGATTFSSADPAIVSVTTNGFVTALTLGSGRVIASSGGRNDTVPITVVAPGASICGSSALQTLTPGQVAVPATIGGSARICLGANASNAEYALVTFSSVQSFATTTAFDVFGLGLTGVTSPIIAGDANANARVILEPTFATPTTSLDAPDPRSLLNRRAELERRELERRELTPLVQSARETMRDRASPGEFPSASLRAVPVVGDLIKLNAQPLFGCSNTDMRTGRVMAVGTKSIVVADTLNPSGGYASADFTSIAATFDTLVYPVDTDNFGTPTDISGYGRVILFYTSAVNALTPSNAGYIIGGFFFSRDLYPKTAKNGLPACAGSNEAEMFYLLVPDPNGTINNNKRITTDVTRLNLGTVAHEFQHLINSSRRLYVNTNAQPGEEVWLDEGLSHIAEELLYFRISNFGTRDNLNVQQVAGTPTASANFSSYAAQNFARWYEYMRAPEVNSPYAPNDSFSTRGATWNFLRYAAGRQPAGTEPAFFKSIVNSQVTGLNNLTNAMPGGQLASFLSDWSVANFADDFPNLDQSILDARYKHPAWNFRSIYPNLRIGGSQPLGVYPLLVRSLNNNMAQRISIAGGGSNYVRFAIPATKSGVIVLSTNGAAPSSALKFAVMRLR